LTARRQPQVPFVATALRLTAQRYFHVRKMLLRENNVRRSAAEMRFRLAAEIESISIFPLAVAVTTIHFLLFVFPSGMAQSIDQINEAQ
jgi:hypothetical protein